MTKLASYFARLLTLSEAASRSIQRREAIQLKPLGSSPDGCTILVNAAGARNALSYDLPILNLAEDDAARRDQSGRRRRVECQANPVQAGVSGSEIV